RRTMPFQRAVFSVGGMIYIGLPLALFAAISLKNDYRFEIPLGYFILIWSSDTFAYLCGKAFGRHPLFASVSPKKTWEGSIGGTLCTIGVSAILWHFYPVFSLPVWMGLALIIMVFGTWGDLI